MSEEYNEFDGELYEDFRDMADLLNKLQNIVIKSGDVETLLKAEKLFEDEGYPARRREISKKLNEKFRDMDSVKIEPKKSDIDG